MTGASLLANWKLGFLIACYGSTYSKSKWYMTNGSVNVVMNSASVFPRHILLPPKNGQKAKGLRG